jgi:hypothetical protein
MLVHPDPSLVERFKQVLNDEHSSEQTVQDFLESNPRLFHAPHELNHGIHLELLISKFKLDTSLTTDFMYLTKSSAEWWCVLVELEHPGKKLFTNSAIQSAPLTAAIAQVRTWRTFISQHALEVVRKLDPIRKPLSQNRVRFKYVLVIGRTEEFKADQAKVNAFAELQEADFRVLTYDSFIHAYEQKPGTELDVLSQRGQKYGFKVRNRADTDVFSWLSCNDLELTPNDVDELRGLGYEIDAWLSGKALTVAWGKKVRDPSLGLSQLLRPTDQA